MIKWLIYIFLYFELYDHQKCFVVRLSEKSFLANFRVWLMYIHKNSLGGLFLNCIQGSVNSLKVIAPSIFFSLQIFAASNSHKVKSISFNNFLAKWWTNRAHLLRNLSNDAICCSFQTTTTKNIKSELSSRLVLPLCHCAK